MLVRLVAVAALGDVHVTPSAGRDARIRRIKCEGGGRKLILVRLLQSLLADKLGARICHHVGDLRLGDDNGASDVRLRCGESDSIFNNEGSDEDVEVREEKRKGKSFP